MSRIASHDLVEPSGGTFLGHPKGLFVLFFTEMWERFSYYGMRALLMLYMVDFFKWTQEDASRIYKIYTSLVYLTPLLGGFLADRYLGNKIAIVIGAILMAVGQFMMTVADIWVFYTALGFLIMGNGFFKPNMSVQVGRLYPQNDPRRDGAYTIFYMGINVGAFMAPLICGALREAPGFGFHWGFAAAGVGMICALLFYLLGLPWIKELPEGVEYRSPETEEKKRTVKHAMTEEEAKTTPSTAPIIAASSPAVLVMFGVLLIIAAPILYWTQMLEWIDATYTAIAGACSIFGAWILAQLSMAVRDRVLAIYVLSIFVIFFWSAFEQAGNAMNVWADQTTNRFLTETPPEPELYPKEPVDLGTLGFWAGLKKPLVQLTKINPVLTTSFQSINPLVIVLFAPIFAWLWTFLARRQVHLSIAAKMAMGIFLQGVAFALMIWAALYENQPSTTELSQLPPGVIAAAEGGEISFYDTPDYGKEAELERYRKGEHAKENHQPMIAHGGRMTFNESADTIEITGVLNANHRDRILRATVPKDYLEFAWELTKASQEAKARNGDEAFTVERKLTEPPPGFEPRYLRGFKLDELQYDETTQTFKVSTKLADKDYKQILVAGANPEFRDALNGLYVQSAAFKVSSFWLVGFYILCTLGELCLSPVGLSMVSKLAPRRFATMLMGMWLLTSFFGNFLAGLAGEKWEFFEPTTFFIMITIAMTGAAAVCYLIARKVTAMMHGVH